MQRKLIALCSALALLVALALVSVAAARPRSGAQAGAQGENPAQAPAGRPPQFRENPPVVVAQLSDLHIGLHQNPMTHAPLDPLENLRRAIQMVNERHPDVIIVSGDIGENPAAWQQAREALKAAQAKVYYVPGNHDVHSRDVARYRGVFGEDYYKFRVRSVEFYVLDSELLGNYDEFSTNNPAPLPPETVAESNKMLKWLAEQVEAAKKEPGTVRIAVQHIPTSRGGSAVPDQKPYWITQEPYRSKEIDLLHQLGVKDILAGHWHKPVVFDEHGFKHHIAPAVSWATKPPIGFAIETIWPAGKVDTEFVELK